MRHRAEDPAVPAEHGSAEPRLGAAGVPLVYARTSQQRRRVAFGQTVLRRRAQWGLERSTLAHSVGMRTGELADIESGFEAGFDAINDLAEMLGTDAAELLHETRALLSHTRSPAGVVIPFPAAPPVD